MRHTFLLCLALIAWGGSLAQTRAADSLTLVVMDPLSKPLSCDCVKGYAQRDYQTLASKLEATTGKQVKVVWNQSLAEALKETGGRADLVIGKHSVVVADGKGTSTPLVPIAQLTGKDGRTTQHGLIVVRSADAAGELGQLAGYQLLLGPVEAEEKAGAAEEALQNAGVSIADAKTKRFGACSEAALAMLAMPKEHHVAAVISSYAEPLLKGCGSIREGELKVVGRTKDVPFVTLFLNKELPTEMIEEIQIGLLTAGTDPEFRKSLETLAGFVPWSEPRQTSAAKPSPNESSWRQFRGDDRSGLVKWLPESLPDPESDLVWSRQLASAGLGGIAVADGRVVVSGRDAEDQSDTFTAFSLADGKPIWHATVESPSSFDYGNSPRATPVIDNGTVFTFGAGGILSAIDLNSGLMQWQANLPQRFKEFQLPTWGYCCSPLVLGDQVIVQLGKKTPLVSIDRSNGETRWSGPGRPAAYSSIMSTEYGGKQLLVGVDQIGYFIRSAADGRFLWLAKRSLSGDFGVPAPVIHDGHLYFTGENNGVEVFDLDEIARATETVDPTATSDQVLPDSHTPVISGDLLLVAFEGLHGLDITDNLKTRWTIAEDQVTGYASIIASEDRALVATENNQLLLIDLANGEVSDKLTLLSEGPPLLSHPAIVGDQLLVRVGEELRCYRLRD